MAALRIQVDKINSKARARRAFRAAAQYPKPGEVQPPLSGCFPVCECRRRRSEGIRGKEHPLIMDTKRARATAQTTAKALHEALAACGIEWPFIRGEITRGGNPIVALGKVHEETARRLVHLLRKAMTEEKRR